MPAHFAMPVLVPSAVPAGQGDGEGLAALVAAGPGLREDDAWLAESRREGLIGSLLAGGVIAEAAAGGTRRPTEPYAGPLSPAAAFRVAHDLGAGLDALGLLWTARIVAAAGGET